MVKTSGTNYRHSGPQPNSLANSNSKYKSILSSSHHKIRNLEMWLFFSLKYFHCELSYEVKDWYGQTPTHCKTQKIFCNELFQFQCDMISLSCTPILHRRPVMAAARVCIIMCSSSNLLLIHKQNHLNIKNNAVVSRCV